MQTKNYLILWLAVLFVLPSLTAQQIDLNQFKNIKIRNIGPAGMSGRVTAIDVVLADPDIIYVGTASGGVWRSTSGGIDWEPIFDEAGTQSIGAIAINQKNPDEIWVGTGEGNPRNSQNSGNGLYKSIDGGRTWKRVGLEGTKTIHRIIIHRDDPNTVLVAALGSAWGPNEERGVYKTTDGGKTWRKVLYVNDLTGCADLVVDPQNPNKFFAAMWEYQRKPWTFRSGGEGSGLYRSYDAGETWVRITEKDGLPKGPLGRIGLAIAPSKPNIVYAIVEAKENAFYKSTDGGHTWKKTATKDIGNRPFYYSDIFVDPKNENRVWSLFSVINWSQDGGEDWQQFLGWKIHPDHHAFWIHPDDPSYIIEGNDGGLAITRDGGQHWEFIDNLPLAQFYHISVDNDIPYHVAGGMQDNGSWVGPSQVWKRGGIRNSDWQEVFFGDGFDVVFKPDDSRYVYAMSQGGNVAFIDRITGKMKFVKPVHPDGIELRFNWNAGIAQDPFHPCGVYFGSQFLHYSPDCGDTWQIISPDLTTNDTIKQQESRTSGGLTPDVTNAENFTTIIAIAPSPLDSNLIWVGTDDGNLQLTRDGGKTWTNLADRLPDCPAGSWIPQIRASTYNPAEAFVVVNNYRRNDWRPMAYYTNDYGQTFTRIADESQIGSFVLSIVQDPEVPELLFLGADDGLYFSLDFGKHWQKWDKGLPSVQVADLQIHPREGDLIIGTFGRAAWIFDDIRPLRELARTKGKVLEKALATFEAPDAYLAEYRSVEGVRFTGDGMFVGDNRPSGALLTVWLNKDSVYVKPKPTKDQAEETPEPASAKKKGKRKGKKKAEATAQAAAPESAQQKPAAAEKKKAERPQRPPRVKVQVLDEAGDTIRTFTARVDTGMNRITWNLTRDGVEFPSRQKRRPEWGTPSGPEVLPGTYKVIVSFRKWRDSTMVTVHPDPRLPYDRARKEAQLETYMQLKDVAETANTAWKRIGDARKSLGVVKESISFLPDSTKKELGKEIKSLNEKLDSLEVLFVGPKEEKGINRQPETVVTYLWQAARYIEASDGPPNQNARISMDLARKKTAEAVQQVNDFLEGPYKDFKDKVNQLTMPLFKETEPVEIKW